MKRRCKLVRRDSGGDWSGKVKLGVLRYNSTSGGMVNTEFELRVLWVGRGMGERFCGSWSLFGSFPLSSPMHSYKTRCLILKASFPTSHSTFGKTETKRC